MAKKRTKSRGGATSRKRGAQYDRPVDTAKDPSGTDSANETPNSTSTQPRRRRQPRRPLPAGKMLAVVFILCVGAFVIMKINTDRASRQRQLALEGPSLDEIPFDGRAAYGYLEKICEIGPRPTGSTGMTRQQQMLTEHFTQLGAKVERQTFQISHPMQAGKVEVTNLIVRWNPERKERLLLCAHYDTLPYPLLDPVDPRGVFIGANDGGSGVALLMELGKHVQKLDTTVGIDFVFFDAEEFIFSSDDTAGMFIGSKYFARNYARGPRDYKYRWGVLLDMIADADLLIPRDYYSMQWRDTRPLVDEIWAIARRLNIPQFVDSRNDKVNDDHLPLHNTGKIPCIDIIDLDYPSWHTRGDTIDRCSAESLARVGWVVLEWLESQK